MSSKTRAATALVYGYLALVTCGLLAADRGVFWDELAFFHAFISAGESHAGLAGMLRGQGPPTRVLLNVPYLLAWMTPDPALAGQIMLVALWLATGALVERVVRALYPLERSTSFLAGALALTATSDCGFSSLVYLGIQFHVVAFLLSLLLFLQWWRGAPPWRLGAAVAALGVALWSYEAALPAALAAPLLAWFSRDSRPTRRELAGTAIACASAVPFAIVYAIGYFETSSYIDHARARRPIGELVATGCSIFASNFTPWRWATHRALWSEAAPSPGEVRLGCLLAGIAAALVLALFLVLGREGPGEERPRERSPRAEAAVLLWFLVVALLGNAAYAPFPASSGFLRTNSMSAPLSSIALALLVRHFRAWLGTGRSATIARAGAIALGLAFVFLGVLGGLERQLSFTTLWRCRHREEMRSIATELPGLADDARVVLFRPECSSWAATEADYLARWLFAFLHGDATLVERVLLWNRRNGARCEVAGDELLWTRERGEKGKWPLSRCIFLVYSSADGRYHLERSFPSRLFPAAPDSGHLYRPVALIRPGEIAPRAARMLDRPLLLARFLDLPEDLTPGSLSEEPCLGCVDSVYGDAPREAIVIQGWASVASHRPARQVLLVDEAARVVARSRPALERRDVVSVHGRGRLLRSGFRIRLDLDEVSEGEHRFRVYACDRAGEVASRVPGEAVFTAPPRSSR